MRKLPETFVLGARARHRGQVQPSPVGFTPRAPLVHDIPRAQHRSLAWRVGDLPSLRRRRRAAGAALGAACVMSGLSLYQLGIVRRLPELPLPGFDANRVDASAQAYQLTGLPDASLGVVSYAVTAALAAAGGPRPPTAVTFAFVAKASLDLAFALKLTADQALKHKAACSWCLLASSLTLSTFVSAAAEARAVWRERS